MAAALMMAAQPASADEGARFRIDATLTQGDEAIGTPSILVGQGNSASIEVADSYRMTVSLSPSDDRVLLNARIERPDGNGWVTVSEPRILFDGSASMQAKTADGLGIRLEVAPAS